MMVAYSSLSLCVCYSQIILSELFYAIADFSNALLGQLPLSRQQGQALGVATGKRLSPLLELCCLCISANVSYANAESDVEMLTGMRVSDNTQQRLVQTATFPEPVARQPITEACVDGGKVRIRTPKGEISAWRDYKAIATDQGVVANLQRNQVLIDWTNRQPLSAPVTCLGDGHDGIWNIIKNIATPETRREVLDWFHLKENLHKIGGLRRRLRQAETYLWQGQVDEAITLFQDSHRKQAQCFIAYLEKHRHRIINYDYYQTEGICSIGSGAVESAVKQIDYRIQIVGAQWQADNVPQVLAHRTAYLNGLFSLKG